MSAQLPPPLNIRKSVSHFRHDAHAQEVSNEEMEDDDGKEGEEVLEKKDEGGVGGQGFVVGPLFYTHYVQHSSTNRTNRL